MPPGAPWPRIAGVMAPTTDPAPPLFTARGVNQRFGAACDEVHLVVAGRVLRL